MEVRCIQSPTLSRIPPSRLMEKTLFLRGHTGMQFSTIAPTLRFKSHNVRPSGSMKIKSSTTLDATSSDVGNKDEKLVFVAGATGRVGSRTVRELLKLGFRVRAGVRSTQKAEPLVKSVKDMKSEDVGGNNPIDMLELVECDLEKPAEILPALGNSSTVICSIGASEKEVFDVTGPYRIDYQATKNLIDAATSAKVDQFILVTSLGTNKFGFPAAILNLFWGVLCWKRKAEEALLASGLPYTIVRPGGMERPTDSFKETHNLTLSEEDTLFGGLVSNLQVAELMAFMAKNRHLSCFKIVEVVAETTAPLTPFDELLKKIPSKGGEIPTQKAVEESKVDETKTTIAATAKATSAQSPFVVYEDLKPPTSPTPSAPIFSGNNKPTVTVNEKPEPKTKLLSPYFMYEDLKPPTTPTPSAPTFSGNNKPTTTVNDKPEPKTKPLSPYFMYEDLKPPSSPMPSSPKY
ncbi:protein TIC 62, chloroplastic isoform X2 [Andrographis paniculata]|uniref:protein TIC 62, chloroplastic isoform X2 n=1 Tax=Andrographis paniculata TaxID=175694 RepID=UPI0021E8EF22|nr:protein TIC 62, chloroplastic isoform X2 [Andrographis paniculata]